MLNEILSGRHSPVPVCELFDLLIDGDPPVMLTNQKEYTRLMQFICVVHFTPPDMDWDLFGGDTALTNGFGLYYKGEQLFTTAIKKNSDFHIEGFDVEYQVDEKNPHNIVLTARCLLTRILPLGLGMVGNTFGVSVEDDMTSLTTVTGVNLILQGWKLPA